MQHKTAKNILWYGECSCLPHCKHLYSWWRITQTIGIPLEIQKISQWNRCSTYLRNWYPNNQMRYMELKTINWENSSWNYLYLIGGEQVISLQRTKVHVFSGSVSCHGKMNVYPRSNIAWEQRLGWFKSSLEYRTLDGIDREPIEFEWNIFSSATKFKSYCWNWVKHQRILQDGLSSCRCSTISHGIKRQWKRMQVKCSTRFSFCKKRFGARQWSFLELGSEKKVVLYGCR